MRIGFIGAGKVGFTFGRYIAEKRELVREKTDGALCLEVGGYFSASRQSAELAAEFTETCVYDSLEQLCEYSEIIFLTVPDGQIGEVWKSIKDLDIRGRIICHASGAMTSDIFSGITEAGAFGYSIHPMYAISSKYESYKELDNSFFTVEGDDRYVDKVCSVIRALGNSCVRIDGTDKVKYHGAADLLELEKSDSHLAGISQRRESLSERKRMEHCAWRLVDILAPADRVRSLQQSLPRPVCTTAWSSCVSIVKLFFSPFLTDR